MTSRRGVLPNAGEVSVGESGALPPFNKSHPSTGWPTERSVAQATVDEFAIDIGSSPMPFGELADVERLDEYEVDAEQPYDLEADADCGGGAGHLEDGEADARHGILYVGNHWDGGGLSRGRPFY